MRKKLKRIIKDMKLKSTEEEERIMVFFVVISLICHASSVKKLVQCIVNNYNKDV
jgi:hypothetical protein